MSTDKYVLNADGSTRVEPDLLKWAKWFEHAERQIARDILPGDVLVSTVFLGIDHSFFGNIPLLFETMVFGGKYDQFQERYATREEALAGHAKVLEVAKEAA